MAAQRFGRRLRLGLLAMIVLLELLFVESGGLGGGISAAVAFAVAATTAAGAALVVSAVISARSAPAVPRTRIRTAIRDREQRTAFLPQRDPDARGRTRPRAPGSALAATA
ncbi:DUF6412 domain-containing protein [Streptomyces sp. NPDC057638]|uniref:DUF6412 domain-containing protein n=1 Tax=Streptomyces sp. NPDC057638 TaxID=3346190 RepID=UPI0036CB84D3